ncbi:diacylglycerol/lipid kinase family protein [Sandaracinus amylolyticus]|uniref:DAGKc domain-containing protein n=1 Tax=Sandaracinus amylolyticus TaxID=927083 RepID=A0A0F6W264_9BACT|nr:diacylglycerol kinase family protein [Sandaracinus amylolyticus]AKF05505.1 hypothetical protein DB32_002654 [Sandaracinus amylolyticus]
MRASLSPAQDPAWLDRKPDLAVAAGGDGTVAATVRALVGRNVPLAIVRLGTANNIALTLGLDGSPEELLEGLRHPIRRRLDVGIAGGAWGERLFVESAGVGLFQHVLEHEASSADKSQERGLGVLLDELRRHRPRAWSITVDGADRSGEYLLVEAMNIASLGPRVRLAPDADPFDGALDVVLVRERDRRALTSYLAALRAGDHGARLEVPTERARHVHVRLAGASARLDDDIVSGPGQPPSEHLDLRVLAGAVELWLPRPRRARRDGSPRSRASP